MSIGKVVYITSVGLFTGIVCLLVWIYQPSLSINKASLTFPIPFMFAIPKNSQVATLDTWQPTQSVLAWQIGSPDISAKAAGIYDLTTNQFLYEKNTTARLPMASLTKITTALVALTYPKKDDRYEVTPEDLVGEDSMGISSGEVFSRDELLYGMLMHSGNDAAEVLASNFPTGRSSFIQAMNQQSQALGLISTHFTNPTGLQGDGEQYTTVSDLLVTTRFGLTHFPLFRQIVGTFDYDIPATDTHKEYYLENETNLLSSYPGVKGVKDGYTPEAGLCLVTYLEYGGHQYIGVILGSEDRRGEMKAILDYSLKKQGISPPKHG